MRIGEVAGELDITAKTIRYYESIGLIPEAARTPSGYRDYGSDDLERLSFVRSARHLGLALDEIREVLAYRERGESPCAYVLETVRRRTAEIDRQVRALLVLRDELTALTARAEGGVGEDEGRYCGLVEAGSHGSEEPALRCSATARSGSGRMTDMVGPDSVCSVDGCDEPAANTPRAATAAEVVDAPTGELVPLCARHTAEAEMPGSP